jgi:3,4-dihydroxy 2-butanone 4-phosphate synthase / GTP cyclohydrolase II
MRIFADETQGAEHVVLTKGDLTGEAPVLVRVHALNPLEDVLGINPAGRAICRRRCGPSRPKGAAWWCCCATRR